MSGRLDALAARLARRRVAAATARVMAADLPPGLSAVREDGNVVIRGTRLARWLAFDARLRALGRAEPRP